MSLFDDIKPVFAEENDLLLGIINNFDHFDVAGAVAGRQETLGVQHGHKTDERTESGAGGDSAEPARTADGRGTGSHTGAVQPMDAGDAGQDRPARAAGGSGGRAGGEPTAGERALARAVIADDIARHSISRLYTGSAADYDQPSLRAVGTGVGRQAFGWGLYASKNRAVAENHATREQDRKSMPGEASANAHVYEQTWFTDRPEGDESRLLEWNEVISAETLVRIENQADAEGIGQEVRDALRFGHGYEGDNVYDDLCYQAFAGDAKATSEFFARAGIDGMKYPATPRGWNYISFRDDNMRIDHHWVDGEQRYSVRREARSDELALQSNPHDAIAAASVAAYGMHPTARIVALADALDKWCARNPVPEKVWNPIVDEYMQIDPESDAYKLGDGADFEKLVDKAGRIFAKFVLDGRQTLDENFLIGELNVQSGDLEASEEESGNVAATMALHEFARLLGRNDAILRRWTDAEVENARQKYESLDADRGDTSMVAFFGESEDEHAAEHSGNIVDAKARYEFLRRANELLWGGSGARHSVRQTKDGVKYVLLDRPNTLDWNDREAVKEYLSAMVGSGAVSLADGRRIEIGSELPKEYVRSKYAQKVFKNKRLRKLRGKTAQHLDELIVVSGERNAETSNHKKREGGVYYKREVNFGVVGHEAVRGYSAELVTYTESGVEQFYDLVNIKEKPSLTDHLIKDGDRQGGSGILSPNREGEDIVPYSPAPAQEESGRHSVRRGRREDAVPALDIATGYLARRLLGGKTITPQQAKDILGNLGFVQENPAEVLRRAQSAADTVRERVKDAGERADAELYRYLSRASRTLELQSQGWNRGCGLCSQRDEHAAFAKRMENESVRAGKPLLVSTGRASVRYGRGGCRAGDGSGRLPGMAVPVERSPGRDRGSLRRSNRKRAARENEVVAVFREAVSCPSKALLTIFSVCVDSFLLSVLSTEGERQNPRKNQSKERPYIGRGERI